MERLEPRTVRRSSARLRRITATIFMVLTCAVGAAEVPPPDAHPATDQDRTDPVSRSMARMAQAIERVTLGNGLRVVLNTDRSSPTVAVSVTYDVGSRNEREGQSGFAHLFEHMMFQGSRHLEKGEHFALVAGRGGTLNGTTSADRTNYFELLPASELRLALYLEADRMRWLDVTPVNFENQRAVVQEEYRMRVDNTPYAPGMIRLSELVYADYPPYAHSAIGSMEELAAARFEWVREFHARHYAPNNAVLTIAGDFDPDRALDIVREYFGSAAMREVATFDPPPPPVPEAAGMPRAVIEDANANAPAVLWGYRIPPFRSEPHYALELAAQLLADGESSRLYSAYVRTEPLFQSISVHTEDHRGPDQLTFFGVLTETASLERAERALEEAIAELRQSGPTRAELERIRNRLRHAFAFELQSNLARAVRLGEYELFYGDARLLTGELARYLAVTAEEIQRAAAQFLTPERRVVVEVRPADRKGLP